MFFEPQRGQAPGAEAFLRLGGASTAIIGA
jgi:hypothetical protein